MTGIQDLHVEILKMIFDWVIAIQEPDCDDPEMSSFQLPADGQAILNLALTSRRFRDVVEQVGFRYLFAYDACPIIADDMRRREFRRNPLNWPQGLQDRLQRNPKLGNQCRELGVNMTKDPFAEGEEFWGTLQNIVSALPSVTKLWIDNDFAKTPQMRNTLYPRLLGLVKDMSRLDMVTFLTVDHIGELDPLYSIQWPSSVRKLHLGIMRNLTGGQRMLRGVGQECNITSLSIAGIENMFDIPGALEGFPNALEELTLLYNSQLTPHIPFSMRFDGHKHSLRALSLVFRTFGVPETLNVSDCTALEHLSLHYRDLEWRTRLEFGGATQQFAARILGPRLKKLTWVFHYENKPGLLGRLFDFPHSVRELFHRELAEAAGERAAALEEIHVIWVPRKDFRVQYPHPVKAIVVDKVNLSEKVTLTYSAAGMSDETRLEVSRTLLGDRYTPNAGEERT